MSSGELVDKSSSPLGDIFKILKQIRISAYSIERDSKDW